MLEIDYQGSPLRVLIATARGVTRSSLWALLETEPALEPVGAAGDLPTAVRLLGELRPDLVLVDRALLGEPGLRRLPILAAAAPGAAVVLVGMGDHPRTEAYVRRAGGAGYLRLDEAADRLSDVAGMATRAVSAA